MNNLLIEFIEGFIDFIVGAVTAPSRAEAINYLQTQTNGVNNAEGGAWIDAMAVYTFDVGWNLNAGTYTQLRNQIINQGSIKAKAFYGVVAQAMVNNATFNTDPAVPEVTQAIRVFDLQRRRGRVQDKIDFLITARDALPLPTTPIGNLQETAMRQSYVNAIRDLRDERDQLDSRIEANQ